ncbi:membrane protein insertase YidC, partial [Planktotalea frisia]|uniref:membrane protein insertase YidC n=1 Tax=Planktotalea frisia TaxID=696762 RepID=UPI0023575523
MDDQNKNLMLATALSFIVILVWFVLFPPPEPSPADPNAAITSAEGQAVLPTASGDEVATSGAATNTVAEPIADAPRITIETDRLKGSISLLGGRIDELA